MVVRYMNPGGRLEGDYAGVSPAMPKWSIDQRQTTLSVRPKLAEMRVYRGSQAI